uniref:Uncharacterized protein n=1 Tax=Globisporangium ultimum (strain ATCC 200006 / CBS 805.95 / DAOM BR144) TaxID=431595 RepID=K3X0P2_GLOUD
MATEASLAEDRAALAGPRDSPYQSEHGAQSQLGITPASSATAHYHVKSTTAAKTAGDVFGEGIHIELSPAKVSVLHVANDDDARCERHRSRRRGKTHKATLFSAEHIGLLMSLMFASLLTSMLKRGLLPVMKAELKLQQAQLDAAQILLTLPWACSFITGFCSDVFPIFGCHRKSYMVLGWVLTSLALFALAFVNYIREYDLRIQRDDATLGEAERTNAVNVYVFLLGLAAFGGILSVVVAEIYVIQQSRRESVRDRGHSVGTFLLTQFGFEMVGQFVTSVVIFRTTRLGVVPLYSFRSIVLFLVLFSLVPIPALLCFFKERSGDTDERQQQDLDEKEAPYLEKIEDKQNATVMRKLGYEEKRASVFATDDDFSDDEYGVAVLGASRFEVDVAGHDEVETSGRRGTVSVVKDHLSMVWTTLQQEATWHVVRFLIAFTFCTEFTLNYPHQLLDIWCAMSLKMESSGKTLAEAMYFLAVYVWKMLCINGNWRVMLGSTLLGVFLLPQCTYFLLATFDVTRSPDLYVVIKSLRGFIRGMIVVIEAAVTIEIAPCGGEGATFGMIVSIGTVMRLLATTGSNILGNAFDSSSGTHSLEAAAANFDASDGANARNSSLRAIALDTSTVRHRVMVALLVCYGIRLLAVFGLAFLPRQKKELQRMLRRGAFPLRRAHAWSTTALLLGSLAFVAIVNTWIVAPSSSIGSSTAD